MTRISRQLSADWNPHMSFDKKNTDAETFYSTQNGAITERTSLFYKRRQIDIFMLAMAIGKAQNSRKKIHSPSNSIKSDALTEDELWLMCCVALSEDDADIDTLADPKKLIKICEEYSNGGIGTLIELDRQTDLDHGQYEEFLENALKSSTNRD